MANKKIPQYEESQRMDPGPSEVQLNYSAPKINVPNVVNNTGAIIASGAAKIAFNAYEQSKIEENNKVSLLYLQEQEKLQREIDEKWDALNTDEHVSGFNRGHDAIDVNVMNTIKNGEVKRLWSTKLKELRAQWQPKVRAQGWKRQADRGIKVGIETLDAWEKQAGNATVDSDYQTAISELSGVLTGLSAAGYVTDEWAQNQLEARLDRISGIYLKNQIDMYVENVPIGQTVEDIVDFMEVNKVFGETDEKVQRDVMDYAERRIKVAQTDADRASRADKVRYSQLVADAATQLEETGTTNLGVNQAILDTFKDPDDVEAETLIWGKIKILSQGKYRIRTALQEMPTKDVPGYLNGLAKTRENSDVNSKLSDYGEVIYAQRQRMLADDPAQYVLSYATKEEASNPEFIIREQTERYGVPKWNVRLLTNEQAENFVNNLKGAQPDDVINWFDEAKGRYNDKFAVVVEDLGRAKLPISMRIIAGMDTKTQYGIKKKMVEVYRVKEQDLMEAATGINGQSAEDIKVSIYNELHDSENMGAVRNVLINQYGFTAEALREISDVKELLYRTSLGFMVEGGYNATDATQTVMSEFLDKSIVRGENNDYFIPATENLSKRKVANAAEYIKTTLTLEDLPDALPDGTPIKDKERGLRDIQRGGYFTNIPNDKSRLWLVDGEGSVVVNKAGQPIYLTWDGVKKGMYKEKKKEPASRKDIINEWGIQ